MGSRENEKISAFLEFLIFTLHAYGGLPYVKLHKVIGFIIKMISNIWGAQRKKLLLYNYYSYCYYLLKITCAFHKLIRKCLNLE